MFRQAITSLLKWKNLERRSPLILRGARQVGKTYLVRKFAEQNFTRLLEINFELHLEYRSLFERTLDAQEIVKGMERISRVQIIAGETLLFFDEIQECPRAIQALRYFKEQLSTLHVIAAGSLLEFVLQEADYRFPVGRVEYLFLKPLSFNEFLYAMGYEKEAEFLQEVTLKEGVPGAIHEKLLELVRQYWLLGGMPEVLQTYLETKDVSRCAQIQSSLLQAYRADFGKYATKVEHRNLQQIFLRVPGVIAQHFKYVDVDRELRSQEIKRAIDSLECAGLLTPVYATSASGLPFENHKIDKKFKLLFLDIGLANQATHTASALYPAQSEMGVLNQGVMAEQFVGQECLAYAPNYEPMPLYYWQRDKAGSVAEVDYLVAQKNQVIPLEVKAGTSAHLKSLKILMAEKGLSLGVCASTNTLTKKDQVLFVPLYMLMQLERLIAEILNSH